MGSRGRATVATVAVAAMAAVGAAGCGIGSKQQQAEMIVQSRTNALAKHTATGSMTFEVTSKPLSSAIDTTIPSTSREPRSRTITVPIRFDFAGHRADIALTPVPAQIDAIASAAPAVPAPPPPPPAATGPTAVFNDDVAFVKRANKLATERRGWARLDFATLPPREVSPDANELAGYKRLYALANTLSPQYALDLAVGPLAGSVRRIGQENVGTIATTRFHSNISLDKMNADLHLSEDQKTTRRRVFALLGIYSDVNKADFWVDAAGLLRRSRYTFEQRLAGVRNSVVVTVDIAGYGAPVQVAPPTVDETVKVSRYGRFVQASLPAT